MSPRTHPFIEAYVDGQPVSAGFYKRLVEATVRDATGQDADSVELTFDDAGNAIEIPREGAELLVRFGFSGAGSWVVGTFVVEKSSIESSPGGEFLTLSGRGADMRKDLKEPLSEHFDDETLGGIIQTLAGRHGLKAEVSPELASVKVPYAARVDQSALDFATRLADRFGALFSVKGGKMLLVKRGSGSASGQPLPALTIAKSDCVSWRFDVEPRPRFGKASAKWYDRNTGETKIEGVSTGLEGPEKHLRHALASKDEAFKAAASEGERLSRGTASGSITLAGLPEAQAEANVTLSGFRKEANGLWRVASVEHHFGETFETTLELEAPEGGRA
ncbi:contractile injection system protein, VgrG/Pvc8 family [Breoghania sp.]|uniref:phage late control D family protein n=1 Tax=Breoghania sp. TaxID=2065378 RepID=UPI0029CA7FB1|nr:contractile injection system protein, VgrG/Pvc8 family [Breoghania sp.]